jgi:hypothetical protein
MTTSPVGVMQGGPLVQACNRCRDSCLLCDAWLQRGCGGLRLCGGCSGPVLAGLPTVVARCIASATSLPEALVLHAIVPYVDQTSVGAELEFAV